MLSHRLKQLRTEKHLTQVALAQQLNVTQTAVSQWEQGRTRPDQELLAKLAHIFSVSIDYLLNGDQLEGIENPDVFYVPVFGSIPAGIPIEAIEDVEAYEEMRAVRGHRNSEFFALKLSGNSMYPEYKDGDIVIFHVQETCESGQDCAVMVNDSEATFKRVRRSEKGITLQPLNPNFDPVAFSNHEIKENAVRILGAAWELRRKLH